MRRKEFAVQDTREVDEFLAGMTFGFLAQAREEFPAVTPLNYVLYEGDVLSLIHI